MTEVEQITDPFRILFPKLGIDLSIKPTAFTIFGIDIQWYGIIITFGLVLALIYCMSKMKRFGLDADRSIDAIIGGIVGGIVGARAYFVLMKWDEYKGDLKAIVNIRNGGLAIYGGLIGAIAVGALVCKLRKVKILPMLDIASLGFLIGQGIGRWGNFVNQEAFGTNTDSIFGMTGGTIQRTITNEMAYLDGDMYMNGLEMSESFAVHPCFLYESVWCLLGFIALAWYSKRRKFDGQIFLLYSIWYGIGRFFIEGLRTDSLMVGNIRASQALAALIVVVSAILLILSLSMCKRNGSLLYCDTDESKELLAKAVPIIKKLDDEEKNEKPAYDLNEADNVNNIEVENTEEDKNGKAD